MQASTALRRPPAAVPGPQPGAPCQGVRGWLLVLCLMLTVIGPALSVWLMAQAYGHAAPLAAQSLAVQLSVLASLLLQACAVAFGMVAGLRLWRVRPGAVGMAKHALLFGLAVDVITTALEAVAATVPVDRLLFHVEVGVVPGVLFFTLCLAYLNRSRRVAATYGA